MTLESRARCLGAAIALLGLACTGRALSAAGPLPDPATDEPVAMSKGQPKAVFAGGCFWGVDAVFKHVRGVKSVTSGYAGGSAATALYDIVSDGRTGHAESVEIIYDRSQVTYGQLLKIFFSVTHDPTEVNRQGPDEGTQYRSAIFYSSDEQKRIGQAYIDQLTAAKAFPRQIATEVVPLKKFYPAEAYHQNYLAEHPTSPYIKAYDLPKIEQLKVQFPDIFVARPR
jgi:peptide-methionine (S)-S-oxide reductase